MTVPPPHDAGQAPQCSKHPHRGHSHASVTSDVDMGRVPCAQPQCLLCDILQVRCAELRSTLDRNLRWYGILKCIPFTSGMPLWAQSFSEKVTFDPPTGLAWSEPTDTGEWRAENDECADCSDQCDSKSHNKCTPYLSPRDLDPNRGDLMTWSGSQQNLNGFCLGTRDSGRRRPSRVQIPKPMSFCCDM